MFSFRCIIPNLAFNHTTQDWRTRQELVMLFVAIILSPAKASGTRLSHNAAEEACAMGTVRKRHNGSRADLYGSNVRTPCSPRPMRYDMRTDSDAFVAMQDDDWKKDSLRSCNSLWTSCQITIMVVLNPWRRKFPKIPEGECLLQHLSVLNPCNLEAAVVQYNGSTR